MPRRKITPEQRDLVAQLVKKFEDEPAPDFGDLDDLNIDFDFDDLSYTPAPQPVPCKTPARIAPTTGTIKTSIRIPARVLKAFRVHAMKMGLPHQTLMNRALSAAVMGLGAV